MALPCIVQSMNGYTIEYNSCISKEKKDRGILGILNISVPGAENKEFIFINMDRLMKLYRCLLGIFTSLNSDTSILRTIELPNIKLDEYIGVFYVYKGSLMIDLKSKHITLKDDKFKTTDTIEVSRDKLFSLLAVMGRSIYDEEND